MKEIIKLHVKENKRKKAIDEFFFVFIIQFKVHLFEWQLAKKPQSPVCSY